MVTAAHVLSVNVGHGVERPYASGPVTAIDKRPVDAIEVRDPGPKRGGLGSGVVGDTVGDRRHHGGVTQAVYAYAREDQQWWEEQIGRSIAPGTFGENITTVGVDTTHAIVGETWTIGGVVLRVEVPRIPCATFAGHMGEMRWVKRFAEAGRTGAYLAVLTPGRIETGMPIVVERPEHHIDLLVTFRAFMGDRDAARKVVDAQVLHPSEQEALERDLGRRTG
jgi:MOSC domain-containing protein YiiM